MARNYNYPDHSNHKDKGDGPDRRKLIAAVLAAVIIAVLTEMFILAGPLKQSSTADEADAGTTILISGHGALNKALLMHIREGVAMPDFWGDGLQPNCGIDVVRYDEKTKKYEILKSNRTYYNENIKSRLTQLL